MGLRALIFGGGVLIFNLGPLTLGVRTPGISAGLLRLCPRALSLNPRPLKPGAGTLNLTPAGARADYPDIADEEVQSVITKVQLVVF